MNGGTGLLAAVAAFVAVVLAIGDAIAGEFPLTLKIAGKHKILGTDDWYGARRTVFDFEGYEAWVVEPPEGVKVAEGRPWTWTMQWATAYVERTSVPRLLKEKGWHHATIITFKDKMDERGLEVSARFQKYLVEELGFAKKANLIGMSWGGFFSTRYAVTYPENVARVYLDAPLLCFADFDPSAGETANPRHGPWAAMAPKDGKWSADPRMPLNMSERLARTGIPVFLVYGGQDKSCPPESNAEPFIERFKAAGGEKNLKVLYRPYFGHHPHGVELNDSAIIDFLTRLSDPKAAAETVIQAPVDRWEDAIPLGNGQAGALVWGGGDTLRLSLDRADYWHLSVNTVFGNPAFNWTNLIAYASRDVEERKRIFEGRVGDSTKLPGVRLEMKLGGGVKIVSFQLDMKRAQALVRLDRGGARKTLRAWFASGEPLLRIAVPDGVEVVSSEFVRNRAFDKLGGYPEPEIRRTADEIVYTRGNRCAGEWAKCFMAGVRFVSPDAESDVAWWNDFHAHSSVSVPDARIQHLYDFAMYLYGSGSRNGFAPIALQGLWTADNGDLPPWHGDYHHDLNSQMTYWASPVAGHFDSHDAFATYMCRLMPAFRSFAKRFFGLDRGIVVPGAMGYDGSWIAGKSQYAIPPSNGLWAFSVLFDGWNYCPTRERLVAIYPFGVALADAAERLLLPPDAKGVRRWPISTSPEFGEGDTSAWFPPNSNYDRSILIGFFSQMTALAKAKGDTAAAEKYCNMSRSFGPAGLTADGRYLLAEGRDLTESHRHISHLLDIFPYCAVAPGADARKSLDHFEALGTKEWIGFTPVWAAAMEARLGAGDRALGYLSVFADKFVSRSGLHLNGDQTKSGYSNFTYHPFTLEANFCFARALQEMLIGAYNDGIRLFPAVPDEWKAAGASFSNLRVPGGHRVSAVLTANGTVRGSVTGFSDGTVTLVFPDGKRRSVALRKNVPVGF